MSMHSCIEIWRLIFFYEGGLGLGLCTASTQARQTRMPCAGTAFQFTNWIKLISTYLLYRNAACKVIVHFIQRQDRKKPSRYEPLADLLSLPNPGLASSSSAHIGPRWRLEMQMQKPKTHQTLDTFAPQKTFSKRPPGRQRLLVRPPAVRKVDTVRPRDGHVGEPREGLGVWLGLFFCTRFVVCVVQWGTYVSIFLSLVFLHWPFAGQVTTQHECGFWRSGWTRFESVAGRDLRFSDSMGAKTFHNDNTCLLSRRLYGITSSLLVISLVQV
ncbi:hypothetical protein J3E69DRAFT_333152 [Trichoderma sp. SZMC 28015]